MIYIIAAEQKLVECFIFMPPVSSTRVVKRVVSIRYVSNSDFRNGDSVHDDCLLLLLYQTKIIKL